MSEEALSQIVQIKWLMVALVAIVFVFAGLRALAEIRRTGGVRRLLRASFADDARRLLEDGRHGELLSLSTSRFQEAPGDGLAYWYHAMAAYREGDHVAARRSIRKVGELQPDWQEAHVDPFLRALDGTEADAAAAPPPSRH